LERHVVSTSAAPAAIGPYSQAVFAQGKFFFISGQIGMKTDGSMASGIEEQTRQVIMNMRAILFAGGLDPGDLVKTTIYLTDMNDFQTVNEVYGEMVGGEPPARATVQVSALPKGALVEIEAIAIARM
jgi:2-iminobutanoate/2-iminopropanoate deaminase